MNILLFDDKAAVHYFVGEFLEGKGNIIHCPTCYHVIDALNDNDMSIDVYVMDLNAPTTGLTDEQKSRFPGGLLTGWVLLTDYILSCDSNGIDKAIIYSAYVDELENHIRSVKATLDEKEYYYQMRNQDAILKKSDNVKALSEIINNKYKK